MTCISKQDLTEQKCFTQSETLRKLWIKFCVFQGLGKQWKNQNISQLCPSTKCRTCFAKKEEKGKAFLLTKGILLSLTKKTLLPSMTSLMNYSKTSWNDPWPRPLFYCWYPQITQNGQITFKQVICEMENLLELEKI